MRKFETYSPTDIISANLAENARRQSILHEQEYAHLRELANDIAVEEDLHELIASLPDHRLSSPVGENDLLTNIQKRERARQCVVLAHEIARVAANRHSLSPAVFFPDPEDLPVTARGHIIYQRNSYTNEAFLRFSSLPGRATASYAHSYLASCEAVYNKEAEYCILPIENSSEGHLVGFARLLEQFDLKIAASCDILGNGSARSTRFALIRRNLLPILSPENARMLFEMQISGTHTPFAAEILSAAEICGLSIHRIDSLPHLSDPTDTLLHIAFFTDGADLAAFLFYLAMEAPQAIPVGLYPHLTH